jgi:hypothetical protein
LETKKNRRDFGLILGEKLLACFYKSPSKPRMESDLYDEATDTLLRTVSRDTRSSIGSDQEWTPPTHRTKPTKAAQAPPGLKEVFTSQTSLSLLAYTILALHSVSFDQLLPVFLHHPVQVPGGGNTQLPFRFSGGFGLASGRIGTLFTIFGIVGAIVQFLVFPPVARRYGVLNCYKACTITFPLVYFATPYPALIQNSLIQQTVMLAIMVVKSFCIVFAFPCMTILLTNSAPSLRVLGTLNGFATSLSALGRATGPALSGALFTWGVEHGYVITPWWTLAVISATGTIPVWYIKETDGFATSNSDDDDTEDDNDEEARLPSTDEEDIAVLAQDSQFLQPPASLDIMDSANGAPLVRKRSRSPHDFVKQ